MIVIRNTQRTVTINRDQVKKDIEHILAILDYQDFDIGIWFTSNATIRKYNREYRGKDKPTDILSFPFHPNLKPEQKIVVASNDEKNLGDLIIAPAYVTHDAQTQWDQSFQERLRVLLVHGILHLLGYDHVKDIDFQRMHTKEKEILQKLSKFN